MNAAQIVAAGYDELAPTWGEWASQVVDDPSERLLHDLASRLAEGSRVLDLGCGDGGKTRLLAERFDVVGVDVSAEQLRRARAAAPAAAFVQADLAEVQFPARSFDAVTALYSIVHVPRQRHPRLFATVRAWLRPGGLFLASLSHVGGPDRVDTWLGVEMFFSGFDATTNSRLVREAGFQLLVDDVIWMREPEGEVAFLWILAQRPREAVVD